MTASLPFLSPNLVLATEAVAAPAHNPAVVAPKPGGGKRFSVTAPSVRSLGVSLLREGLLSPDDLVIALSLQKRHQGRLCDILLSRQMIAENPLYEAQARHWAVRLVDPIAQPADPRLIDKLGAATCLRQGLIPWQKTGQSVAVATAYPEEFSIYYKQLVDIFGPVSMAIAPASQIEKAVLKA